MRTMLVVVPDVDSQDPLPVPPPDDQEPVKAVGADRTNPALRIRVRPGRLRRREQHLSTLRAEHIVEAAAELRVTIAQQEPDPSTWLAQSQQQVAGCWVTHTPSGL